MDDKDITSQLLDTFVGELDEHVRSINQDLLALEKCDHAVQRRELIQNLFRAAHTLKGASRTVNVVEIEQVFHRIEGILGEARDAAHTLGAERIELLFLVVDALQDAGERLGRRQTLAGGPLAALLPRLDDATGNTVPVAGPPTVSAPMASAAPAISGGVSDPVVTAPATTTTDTAEESRSARVPVEKLDRLLGRHDELLLASRRLSGHVSDLNQLHEFVERWRRSWRGLRPFLDQLDDGRNAGGPDAPRRSVRKPDGATLTPSVVRALGRADEDLRSLERQLDQLAAGLGSDTHTLKQAAGALSDGIGSLRMMPFTEACAGLARLTRDTALAEGKDVALIIGGGDVELDRAIIQKLKGPLIHLVRNAVAHGIEAPSLRHQRGKSVQGRITVAAEIRGAHVEVVVGDDGGGLLTSAIRAQAKAKGFDEPTDAAGFVELVFRAGFSTTPVATQVSGRGMGLDVVKAELESLHGTIDLWFEEGKGTRFTLMLPLTLTVTRGLTVTAAGRAFAFVGTNVRQVVRVEPTAFRFVEGRDCLVTGRSPIPVASLAAALGVPEDRQGRAGGLVPLVVVAAGDRQMAFVVDELLAERELVIRSLGRRLKRVPNVAGAVQLETGEVALVLNASELIRSVLGQTAGQRAAAVPAASDSAATKRHILVADDSITTRTLEKMILESAGYDVTVAKDGQEAWDLLQLRGADLVVSDIEMPGLTGFELTQKIRGSKRFSTLPLVLVTSRSSDEDKARGAEVGATAYLVKSSFDQAALLKTIARLL